MATFKSPTDLCDVVSAAVLCETDNTMMLVVDNMEHWLPSVKVPAGLAWEKAISKEMQDVGFFFYYSKSFLINVLCTSYRWNHDLENSSFIMFTTSLVIR